QGLRATGIAVVRAHAGLPARHPLFDAEGATWRRDSGAAPEAYAHGNREHEPFRTSPFAHMLAAGVFTLRRRLTGAAPQLDFPILHELRAAGATDYYARLIGFGESSLVRGMTASLTIDAAGGFADA